MFSFATLFLCVWDWVLCLCVYSLHLKNRIHRRSFLLLWPWTWPDDRDAATSQTTGMSILTPSLPLSRILKNDLKYTNCAVANHKLQSRLYRNCGGIGQPNLSFGVSGMIPTRYTRGGCAAPLPDDLHTNSTSIFALYQTLPSLNCSSITQTSK